MIQLSYCTFGLTELPMLAAIDAVHAAGYPGIELSFHRDQFNPFELTGEDLHAVRRRLDATGLIPACVATASHFFTPSRPHEPSLMCLDLAGRKRRIDLIRRGIEVARALHVPFVTFGSGFIRDEHIANPSLDPGGLLADSVHACLRLLHPDEDITLLIEPEPGMYIETLQQAMALIEQVNSPRFRLHVDLCHIYCSEHDMVGALSGAARFAHYLHISDAEQGCNLKIIRALDADRIDLSLADFLLYFPESADFLLLNREHPICFHDAKPDAGKRRAVEAIALGAGVTVDIAYVDYNRLPTRATELDDEVFTYLISVPGLSFDVLERARPVILYLRTSRDSTGKLFMDKRVANTLTGIVHYHEIPGRGSLDFAACFKALTDNGFAGFASVELYHHITQWEQALQDSHTHLLQFV